MLSRRPLLLSLALCGWQRSSTVRGPAGRKGAARLQGDWKKVFEGLQLLPVKCFIVRVKWPSNFSFLPSRCILVWPSEGLVAFRLTGQSRCNSPSSIHRQTRSRGGAQTPCKPDMSKAANKKPKRKTNFFTIKGKPTRNTVCVSFASWYEFRGHSCGKPSANQLFWRCSRRRHTETETLRGASR